MTMTRLLTAAAFLLCAEPGWCQRDRGFSRGRGDSEGIFTALKTRYDTNKDGKISAAEYTRDEGRFLAYDANGDGELTAADFESAGSRGFSWLGVADSDKNMSVSAEEWKAWLGSLGASEAGVVSKEQLAAAGAEQDQAAFDHDGDGQVELEDLATQHRMADRNNDGVLDPGELSGRPSRSGTPAAGEPAPDFELQFAKDTERSVRLSSFAGSKPVALVFGSYT